MKKILILLTALLVISLVTIMAFAHPGRTDSNGGHTDHSTGEYHYHHGYPAHQHIGGRCPYDYEDRTDSGSSSSSGSGSYESSYSSSQSDEDSIKWLAIVIGAVSVTFICAGVLFANREIFNKLSETVGKILIGVWLLIAFIAIACFIAVPGAMIIITIVAIFASSLINNMIEDKIQEKKEKSETDIEDE